MQKQRATYRIRRVLAILAGILTVMPALALDEAALTERLKARFLNDRTGTCVVAAVIEDSVVTRARFCAKPRNSPPDYSTAFEIGSVSKTMTAFLVADLVAAGRWSLDDPIAAHLPTGAPVPRQGERQILVRDLLAHSSGLPTMPSRLAQASESDPYANLTEASLLASLGDVRLSRPIGSRPEYSNFGMMLVSLAVSRSYGDDFERALKTRLFEPLAMKSAFIERQPSGVLRAQGHLPSGKETTAWTIRPNLAGVGMIKASLDDMVRYANAQLDRSESGTGTLMRMTQQPLANGWGMCWALPRAKGRPLATHEGGTGGFSSLVTLDIPARRAVVILADTALVNFGGLADLGVSLLGIDIPVRGPRITQPAPPALTKALLGDYEAMGTPVRIFVEGGKLWWHDPEQGALELLYDSAGEFYPAEGSATLRPNVGADGSVNGLVWSQGGGQLEVVRRNARPPGNLQKAQPPSK